MRRFLLLCLTTLLVAMVAAVPWVAANERKIPTFLSPPARAEIAGPVTVRVAVPEPATRVRFDVSSDDGRTWRPIGTDRTAGDGWAVRWEAAARPGPMLLRAVPTGRHPMRAAVVPVTVVGGPHPSVGAWPPAFSPNADGRKDEVTLTVALAAPAALTVVLTDEHRRAVRRWERTVDAAGATAIVWDGTTAGAPAPDGPYRFTVRAVDAAGRAGTAASTVRLDTRPPAISWERTGPDPVVWHRTAGFTVAVRDAARELRGTLHVLDGDRRIGTRSGALTQGTNALVWRPATAAGAPLPSGTYGARVSVADDAGNIGWSAVRTWRVQHRETARVITRMQTAGRRVALTFDDCYDAAGWRAVLDALRRARAKATFFCPAQAVDAHPSLARRTVREGHAIGAHGYDHARLDGRSTSFVRSRLARDADAWFRQTRRTSAPLFRPPYGAYDARTLAVAAHTGHREVVLWDVDTADWRRPPASVLAARAVRPARAGSIVLMHTLPGTAKAVPAIVRGLRAKGLEPVTLPALIAAAERR